MNEEVLDFSIYIGFKKLLILLLDLCYLFMS